MSPLALSVVLALASAVAYAAAAVVQERVAACAVPPPRRPAWWGSVLLNGLGAALHVAALAYGPLSLVQPLGALTIVCALPMAALFAGRRAWRGALTTTAGLAGLLSLTTGAGARSPGDGQRWLLTGAALGTVGVLLAVARLTGRPVPRGVALAAAAGVSFGAASVLTKTVAGAWTPRAPFAEWTSLLVLSAFAVGGLLLSQASYRGAGLAAPLATLTVVDPVVAAAAGVALFGEGFRHGTAGASGALVCGGITAYGLVLLTLDRAAPAPGAEPGRAPAAGTAAGTGDGPDGRAGAGGAGPDGGVRGRRRAP
ncbi:hypothetical protein [Streptomyces sp. NPDC001744]|uniref:hypothetical protein n=1 Tax=Streptomyces sp. NPDC001744 TaxID=3364606 RepID=UPI0036929D6D